MTESKRRRRDDRKSISMNGDLHARFRAFARRHGTKMATLLEPRLNALIDEAERLAGLDS